MSALFGYPREDWFEQRSDKFEPMELEQYKMKKVLFELEGVSRHNQAEFDLGDLKVITRFEEETSDMGWLDARLQMNCEKVPALADRGL